MEYKKYRDRGFRHILSIPFIYLVLIPVIFLDFFIEFYHRICFLLYGLPYVKRGDYIRIDRHKLSYLTLVQKINCMYCGYVNGFAAYFVRICADTENYWCGIQHAKRAGVHEQAHHKNFLEYDNKEAFEEKCKLK